MLGLALALALAAVPPADAGDGPGRLVLGPADATEVRIVDASGQPVATAAVRTDQTTRLSLAPGRYRIVGAGGAALAEVEIASGRATKPDLPGQRTVDAPRPTTARSPSPRSQGAGIEQAPRPKQKRWKRWGSPLLSTLLPGLGQAVNGQGGKAVAVFASTLGLALGSFAVFRAGDNDEGATPGDEGATRAQEIARLGAFSGLTSAAGLLYLGQIMDAHAVAVGKRARPRKRHFVAIDATRASTVGIRPGNPSYALYDDWSFTVMGQVANRVSVGLSDLSLKFSRPSDQLTVQIGVRAKYRFYDARRVWLAIGGGFIFQGTSADGADDPVDPDAEEPEIERRFGAIPYVQFETRWFLLDRWSLNFMPRYSLPLTHRDYRAGKKIPRYASTFELVLGVGVYF